MHLLINKNCIPKVRRSMCCFKQKNNKMCWKKCICFKNLIFNNLALMRWIIHSLRSFAIRRWEVTDVSEYICHNGPQLDPWVLGDRVRERGKWICDPFDSSNCASMINQVHWKSSLCESEVQSYFPHSREYPFGRALWVWQMHFHQTIAAGNSIREVSQRSHFYVYQRTKRAKDRI